ncbi:unnamed protein product [Rhizophagus irregularis]|nr:unnamed protein product [Rhizophagus irregularis]CAB4414572.1 unnamed protein product [Rhizophagus irregularis]
MRILKLFIDLNTLIKFLEEIKDNHSEVEVENNNDVNNNEVDNNMILEMAILELHYKIMTLVIERILFVL